jgi:hypothetical protein
MIGAGVVHDASAGLVLQCVEQVANRKQGESEYGTAEVDIVTGALLLAPPHLREENQAFANMSKDN